MRIGTAAGGARPASSFSPRSSSSLSTGRHLLKSEPDRPSSTPHESQPFILPVMTRPHSLRGKSMRLPKWEEEMIIAEEILYLLHPKVR